MELVDGVELLLLVELLYTGLLVELEALANGAVWLEFCPYSSPSVVEEADELPPLPVDVDGVFDVEFTVFYVPP